MTTIVEQLSAYAAALRAKLPWPSQYERGNIF
jgi:hypothetical protein